VVARLVVGVVGECCAEEAEVPAEAAAVAAGEEMTVKGQALGQAEALVQPSREELRGGLAAKGQDPADSGPAAHECLVGPAGPS
jgi:hypothetical protein